MKQMPSKQKYKKAHRGSLAGKGRRYKPEFCDYGMQALEAGYVTANQLEACRVVISRELERRGTVVFRVFPDIPVSQKPRETRMGSGKGSVVHYAARIRPGDILIEISGVPEQKAIRALAKADSKLGIKTRYVIRLEVS